MARRHEFGMSAGVGVIRSPHLHPASASASITLNWLPTFSTVIDPIPQPLFLLPARCTAREIGSASGRWSPTYLPTTYYYSTSSSSSNNYYHLRYRWRSTTIVPSAATAPSFISRLSQCRNEFCVYLIVWT